MPPKKKKSGKKKLAKMTEEERLLYMEQKRLAEEEMKKKKEDMLTQFLKVRCTNCTLFFSIKPAYKLAKIRGKYMTNISFIVMD